ncbi:MAG TPA: HAMP domain-containing histidine kinase [Flavobacteriaceae bacterium]|nr:HAMP domain-containing histidine kinase [Flavobacteriaceae bacterium]HIP26574.1 HAMP domain-containing histidine kinase [Flavobacteriaceae bacterium]
MLLLVLIASIITAILTFYQYNEQGKDYHRKRLIRKENNIKATIKNELDRTTYAVETAELPQIFRDQIYNISHNNKLDIYIYDLEGKLLKSSVPTYPQDEKSYDLLPDIVHQLENSKNKRVLTDINKNDNDVQYSYTYIENFKFKPIGILGLPYLQDNTEQEKELNEFLKRLVLAYLIIFLIAITIAYLLSSYITKSFKKASDKINQMQLGKHNEKIEIEGTSKEFSILLNAYNQKVDELEESAVKLAKSEREEAWREMAKQVAHEINNPLTPMRLTIQSFTRRFNPKDENYKEKLKEFSNTMILQIDTLTSIASAFSNFAKMPTRNDEELNVVDIVKKGLEIFNEHYITYHSDKEIILANLDRIQLTRIVTNLVKNATQALTEVKNPKIEVKVKQVNKQVIIKVSDNGKGIADEHKNQVFEPKFTTKSSGMGLGLAMVKNIIEAYNGSIDFTSILGKGTTFTVKLPIE